MKRWRRFFCMSVSFCMLCLFAISALAAEGTEPYTYKVRFFSGKQGSLNGEEVVVLEGLHYGDQITFNRKSVVLNDGSKYYFKGIRRSGEDNNTVGRLTFTVKEDQDYVVAYGILGNRTSYTVNYVDEAGNALAESETYYGNVGDKPVVAYLYIDNYRPQAYNLTQTLSENAADNEFTFVYTPIPAATQPETEAPSAPTQEAPTTPATESTTPATEPTTPATEPATPAPAPAAPEEVATVIPGEEVPAAPNPGNEDETEEDAQDIDEEVVPLSDRPEEIKDLDDEDVPLAGGIFSGNATLLGIPVPVILVAGAAIAGAALWYFLLFRKRKKKESKS